MNSFRRGNSSVRLDLIRLDMIYVVEAFLGLALTRLGLIEFIYAGLNSFGLDLIRLGMDLSSLGLISFAHVWIQFA